MFGCGSTLGDGGTSGITLGVVDTLGDGSRGVGVGLLTFLDIFCSGGTGFLIGACGGGMVAARWRSVAVDVMASLSVLLG